MAAGWGDRVALREGSRAITYGQLRELVAKAATALKTLRVVRGDRVAILMPDTIEAAISLLGAIYHGAIAVPLSELADVPAALRRPALEERRALVGEPASEGITGTPARQHHRRRLPTPALRDPGRST